MKHDTDGKALELGDIPPAKAAARKPAGKVPVIPPRLRPVQELILELVIAEPHLTLEQVAEAVGRTSKFVRAVTNTSLFQQRYAELRQTRAVEDEWEGLMESDLLASMKTTALESLEQLRKLIPAEYDLERVSGVSETMLRGLGLGGHAPKVAPNDSISGAGGNTYVQVNMPASVLAAAQSSFGKPAVIEGKVISDEGPKTDDE